VTVDWEMYAAMLDGSDWTDDQKRELIETLWTIVLAFVDLGFGVHTSQSCGQDGDQAQAKLADMVSSTLTSSEQQDEPCRQGVTLDAPERSPSCE
tara:strand:+ start:62 stop:346 length:285 start_codon:yes stop_codon:yes gene_type:complete